MQHSPHARWSIRFVLPLLGVFAVACQDAPSGVTSPATANRRASAADSPQPGSSLAWQSTARAVLHAHALDPVPSKRPSPNAQVRMLAYLGLAQYTAVVTAEDTKDHGTHASPAAAAASASAAVLSYFLPSDAPAFQAQLQAQSLADPGPVERQRDFASGAAVGNAVAAAVIARASTDRFAAPFTGTIPVGPGFWRSSNSPPTPPLLPMQGKMRPFFLDSGSQFRPGPPPTFGSPEYLTALAEIRQFSDTRTPEQLAIAKYWAVPWLPTVWNEMLADMIVNYRLDERKAAHAFALTFMAAVDGTIACHDGKYTYWFVRPSQADPGIVLAVPLPNHPSYPSNHACIDGTLDVVMSNLFPAETDKIHAAMIEGAVSRLYGGLHYRFDTEAGLAIGQSVGNLALSRDVHGHEPFTLQP